MAHIGLGANLGDARATLQAALQALSHLPGCRLQQVSSVYRSAPVDAAGPDFFNAVAGAVLPLGERAGIGVVH